MRGPDFVRARFCLRVRAAPSPLGTVSFERDLDAQGQRLIWVEAAVADKLAAMRGRHPAAGRDRGEGPALNLSQPSRG
jgi:hypothetical protein